MTSSIPDEFMCPITLEIMDDPVLCEDGYTYERTAIMGIQNSLSPMTRQPFDKSRLIPNRGLKSAIDRFLSSNPEYQDILLERERIKKEQRDKELKAQLELEQKLEKERLEKEKRYQEENKKMIELRKLREERLLYEKREREKKIKYEEDQRAERLRLEQIEQQKIRDEHEKGIALITKYNGKNPIMCGHVFRHEYQRKTNNKGILELIKEGLMDGEKGLSCVMTKKVGDKFHRINIQETSKNNFELKEKIDEEETTKEIDMVRLVKMIKSNKDLAFVKNYIENERNDFQYY